MSNQFLTRLSAILLVLLLLLGVFAIRTIRNQGHTIDEQVNLIVALNDTVKTVRLENGDQKATIKSLSTGRTEDFLTIQSQDSSIRHLQQIVRDYKGKLSSGSSVVTVKGETIIRDTGSVRVDTVSNPVWPTYTSLITKKWYTANMRMNGDSSFLNLKVVNAYDVIVYKEKKQWVADVINHNPYSQTLQMRAYNVEIPNQRPKRVALALFGGYGLPLNGSNNTLKSGPFIGAGIAYNFLYLF